MRDKLEVRGPVWIEVEDPERFIVPNIGKDFTHDEFVLPAIDIDTRIIFEEGLQPLNVLRISVDQVTLVRHP